MVFLVEFEKKTASIEKNAMNSSIVSANLGFKNQSPNILFIGSTDW